MKQYRPLVILFFLTFFTGCLYAQSTEKIEKVATEVNANVNANVKFLTEKVEAMVTTIAQTLKVPAEHIYVVLVKQQKLKAIAHLGLLLLFVAITIFFWILFVVDKDFREELWGIPVFVTLLLIGVIIFLFPTILGGFYNPEYGAIKEIMSLLD